MNGTQIFAFYCDRVLGHQYLLWLKIFMVPFYSYHCYNREKEDTVLAIDLHTQVHMTEPCVNFYQADSQTF